MKPHTPKSRDREILVYVDSNSKIGKILPTRPEKASILEIGISLAEVETHKSQWTYEAL